MKCIILIITDVDSQPQQVDASPTKCDSGDNYDSSASTESDNDSSVRPTESDCEHEV